MVLPPPKLWQEFEELTRDVIRFAINDPGAKNYGNPGATQHGVDVYGRQNGSGHLIGIQCKRRGKTDSNGRMLPGGLTVSELAPEIAKARGFPHALDRYVLATTDSRQTKLQDEEIRLNELQLRSASFTFEVWFWDDFQSYLHKYGQLLQWYYDSILRLNGVYDADRQILYLFHMAFSRPAFSTRMSTEESGPALLDALKDTMTALNTGELRDRETRGIIRAAPGGIGLLSSPTWRSELEKALRFVAEARRFYKQARDEKKIVEHADGVNVLDGRVAMGLDKLRGDAIRVLNPVLESAGLPEVVSPL